MPPDKKLLAAIGLKRRRERLFSLELSWSVLHCDIFEGRNHARVPVLPQKLLEFVVNTLVRWSGADRSFISAVCFVEAVRWDV